MTTGDLIYRFHDAPAVLRSFRELMAEAPDSFQADAYLFRGDSIVVVSFCHAGDPAEVERLLRPLRTVATPSRDTVKRQSYASFVEPPRRRPRSNRRSPATVALGPFIYGD